MSYLNGLRSSFPSQIDEILELFTLPASQKNNALRYQFLITKKNLTSAEQEELNQLTGALQNYIIDVEKWNKFGDVLINMQKFFKENVEDYIYDKQSEFQAEIDKFSDRGTYSSSTPYFKNNFVTWNDGSGNQTYLCLQNVVGVAPSNTSYWRKLTIQGAKGDRGADGVGLTMKGTWQSDVQYQKDSAVSHNGMLFGALQANQGQMPNLTQDTDYWVRVLGSPVTTVKLIGHRIMASNTNTVNLIVGEITSFNRNTDNLAVFINSTRLTKGVDYTINTDNQTISKISGTWDGTINPIFFEFEVTRNQINNLVFSDGQSIANETITQNKLSTDLQQKLQSASLIKDDITLKNYKWGVLNGLIYIEEV